MCKGQFYVYSSLGHLLWNGIIFCNISWYLAYHMTHGALIFYDPAEGALPGSLLCPKILAGALITDPDLMPDSVTDILWHLI